MFFIYLDNNMVVAENDLSNAVVEHRSMFDRLLGFVNRTVGLYSGIPYIENTSILVIDLYE